MAYTLKLMQSFTKKFQSCIVKICEVSKIYSLQNMCYTEQYVTTRRLAFTNKIVLFTSIMDKHF